MTTTDDLFALLQARTPELHALILAAQIEGRAVSELAGVISDGGRFPPGVALGPCSVISNVLAGGDEYDRHAAGKLQRAPREGCLWCVVANATDHVVVNVRLPLKTRGGAA